MARRARAIQQASVREPIEFCAYLDGPLRQAMTAGIECG
jgi:hypothetical protein